MQILFPFAISMETYLIAITTDQLHLRLIITTLFESVILLKCEMFLDTCPNQFGLKKGHSTDMCIYILKEMIEYFKSRSTSLFVTFLMHQIFITKLTIGNCLTSY